MNRKGELREKGRREERSQDGGRLYTKAHFFPVTFNIQLSLLTVSVFGVSEFWSEISKEVLLLQTTRSNP